MVMKKRTTTPYGPDTDSIRFFEFPLCENHKLRHLLHYCTNSSADANNMMYGFSGLSFSTGLLACILRHLSPTLQKTNSSWTQI